MSQTLVQQVIQYSKEYHMLQEGDRVLVGLSGGADSVCLLCILNEIKNKLIITLCIFVCGTELKLYHQNN